jgi:hypothetical protein
MSDYQQFLNERDKIDFLIQKGYRITKVIENLDGAYIDFSHPNDLIQTLQIETANGRKYFSSLLIQQGKAVN